MAQIHLKQPGQPVADFAVNGPVVTVAGVTVDCAARQTDTMVVVEVRANQQGPSEGGDGAYLAQIEIPARRYHQADVTDADDTSVTQEPVALDANAVRVTLWPTT